MNLIVGRFHLKEFDGKQKLVYYLESANDQSIDSPPLYMCPPLRKLLSDRRFVDNFDIEDWENMDMEEIVISPVIQVKISSEDNYKSRRLEMINQHNAVPLFWCKNKDDVDDKEGSCLMCYQDLKIGTDYYFCVDCNIIYHKECVESPSEIKHPYHPDHPLKLLCVHQDMACVCCRAKERIHAAYYCTICTVDCADFPSVIRISRHHHRISFTSSLSPGKWVCGVCRKNVDSEYGAYTCNKCDGYVVHSRCALRNDIWDGKELEGILEEDDTEEVLDPFERISDGLILHFLHDHHLKSETSGEVYDESKICHACVLPIYDGEFYSCIECDFIPHDDCANAPRRKHHPLHPHPLTLKVISEFGSYGHFRCDGCHCYCSCFAYESNASEIWYRLDVRCGSISEPFAYQGHEHPLFLALDPQERHFCQICERGDIILLNCIECDFIICLRCVNLPCIARYKHDTHFLTLVHEKETNEPNWCEICERLLISSEEDEEDKRFYECKQCCTTLHINCLLGKTPYVKPGHTLYGEVQVVANNSLSRPFCNFCENRCVDKLVFHKVVERLINSIACCLNHA